MADEAGALAPLVPTGPPLRPVQRSRWRTVLAVAIAAFPLLCVAAIPFAFHSYDTATRPDRSTPAVAVHEFLQEYLVARDDASANQFICPGRASALGPVRQLRKQIESGERSAGLPVGFTWLEGQVVTEGSDAASMQVDITAAVGGVTSVGSQTDTFSFTAHRNGQWCVASATKIG
jgi:hypothetical protein